METYLYHLQVNVRAENLDWYRELSKFLGWKTLMDGDGPFLGVEGSNGASLWFIGEVKDVANDYDGPGVNHIAIGTKTQAEVDEAAGYLKSKGIPALFETPRHRPEFSREGQTYYQVMFESPDKVLFEIVYIGPRS